MLVQENDLALFNTGISINWPVILADLKIIQWNLCYTIEAFVSLRKVIYFDTL